MKDPKTVVLRAFTSKVGDETDRIHDIIMKKLAEVKNNQSNISATTTSKMDELKKLGELKVSVILTEEEFQKEKKKLLNGK